MISKYPLEGLELLVLQTLDPGKADVSCLSKENLTQISDYLFKESGKIQRHLKNEVFSLLKKREIRLQIRKYHSNLIYLLDTEIEMQKKYASYHSGWSSIADLVIKCLEGLLSFLEVRFSRYLSLDERVPITYLMVSKSEIFLKVAKLKKYCKKNDRGFGPINIVIHDILEFIKTLSGRKATYRQIIYHKELLNSLEDMKKPGSQTGFFSLEDEIFIQKNFNSVEYLAYLTNYLKNHIDNFVSPADKYEALSLLFKEFKQLRVNYNISFDYAQENVKTSIENWFHQEITYLERKIAIHEQCTSLKNDHTIIREEVRSAKIECDLSADQIGLILRAADEARIIKSRSMSLVFQTIVPYLATSFKKELSFQSVRSKSYNAEDRDKEIAIAAIEKIIKKIRSY